ncbi:MAG: HAMP domain-containing histidine kinase [Dysgonamonadaceae bacterium]|jgi:signal transduction histidine kinase|nr:HAMP domain-containing histidine kinase [Dysgonamonadaceae bacterium]
MRKSTIWLFAGVMVFAFIGLLYLQVSYIRIIMDNQKQQFDEAVKRSLYQVSHNLELDQAGKALTEQFEIARKKYLPKSKPLSYSQRFLAREQRRLNITADGTNASVEIGVSTEIVKNQLLDIAPSYGKNDLANASVNLQDAYQELYYHQQGLLQEAMKTLMKSDLAPIEERVNFRSLDSYIRSELLNNNLSLPYHFAIIEKDKNFVYQSPDFKVVDIRQSYSQVLFPKDPPQKLYTLLVSFPDRTDYLLKSVSFIAPSVAFSVVLLIVFILTIVIVFRQKRLSEMKSDFINNMTHELKTPVATISLASQMLKDGGVNKSPQLFSHISGVINDETKRLSFLIEKVLQMSLFEKNKTALKMKELDANDLLANVAHTFVIRVEKIGGWLDVELEAMESTIYVDEMHFTNVLFNLMENAVKYRKEEEPLKLLAKTRNEGDKIMISIQDNGVGIKKENLKKVFERFYRVHTGNRHDVKGFGLGLAYVKKIIDDHNGSIRIESEFGVGTTFTISLPYHKNGSVSSR